MNLEDLDLSPKSVDFEIVRLQIGRFSPSLQSGFNFLPFPPDYLDYPNRPDSGLLNGPDAWELFS